MVRERKQQILGKAEVFKTQIFCKKNPKFTFVVSVSAEKKVLIKSFLLHPRASLTHSEPGWQPLLPLSKSARIRKSPLHPLAPAPCPPRAAPALGHVQTLRGEQGHFSSTPQLVEASQNYFSVPTITTLKSLGFCWILSITYHHLCRQIGRNYDFATNQQNLQFICTKANLTAHSTLH